MTGVDSFVHLRLHHQEPETCGPQHTCCCRGRLRMRLLERRSVLRAVAFKLPDESPREGARLA